MLHDFGISLIYSLVFLLILYYHNILYICATYVYKNNNVVHFIYDKTHKYLSI